MVKTQALSIIFASLGLNCPPKVPLPIKTKVALITRIQYCSLVPYGSILTPLDSDPTCSSGELYSWLISGKEFTGYPVSGRISNTVSSLAGYTAYRIFYAICPVYSRIFDHITGVRPKTKCSIRRGGRLSGLCYTWYIPIPGFRFKFFW